MSDKQSDPYEIALLSAWRELEKLKEQERETTLRKAKLQETIDALYPLVFPDQFDANSLSLPDAMRLVIHSAGRSLSAFDFKTKLEDLGFDISKYDNPLANIHTAMSRMVENAEMIWSETETDGKKKALPGPDLKPVPQTVPSQPNEVRKTLLEKVKELDEAKDAEKERK